MSPASQWRRGVSGAISNEQLAGQDIDRWPLVNATAIISHVGEKIELNVLLGLNV